ncbi:hypothetical protein ACH4OW_26145 [Streptomyces sp. NPDC017056]|uniref:hypothetical protein n=1 Tax=Streptomyces sp. NPDC017056 TaxID=3364973 RepID=UPI0037A59221
METSGQQQVSRESLKAVEGLTEAADAFVAALRNAAAQDTHNRGYWTGFIAQVKHVTEHGGAALEATVAELLPAPEGSPNRVRLNATFAAQSALATAAETTYCASVLFGKSDSRIMGVS